MTDDPIDFSPLDPAADREGFERRMARLRAAAAPELERRRLRGSVWWELSRWRRPVLALGVASALVLFGVTRYTGSPEETIAADDLSLALGVPATVSDWLTADTMLTAAQVLYPGEEQ